MTYYFVFMITTPLIIFLCIWAVENLKLLKSGKIEKVFSYKGQSTAEILSFALAAAVIAISLYKGIVELPVAVTISIVAVIMFIISSNQKIKLTESGIYLDFKYLKWKDISEFRKTDDGKIYIKASTRISGAHRHRIVENIDELVSLGSKFIKNSWQN